MTIDTKLVSIGNSKGIRIPKSLILKYNLQEEISIEEHDNGLLIRPKNIEKNSWEDTYKEMANSQEDWSDWHDFEDSYEL